MQTDRIQTHDSEIVVFDSSAAVGVILREKHPLPPALRQPDRDHIGSFISPEEARKVAAFLLAAADKAEAARNAPTPPIPNWARP